MEPTVNSGTVANTVSVIEPDRGFLEEETGPYLPVFSTLMAVLYLLVCVMGLGGNALVIIAIAKLDRMGTPATVYIFNLALADGLFMVGLPFVAAQNLQGHWVFGDLACKLVMALDGINQFTSAFCLTVMSVDRYMAVADPLRFAGWCTPRRAKVISASLWLLSLLPVLPIALHFSVQDGVCSVDAGHESFDTWWPVFLMCTFVLGFALPLTIMVVSYTALVATLRARGGNAQSTESQHPERQVTRMVVAVVLVFAVCWLPFYTLNFCSLSHIDQGPAFVGGFEFAILLSYSWSCANPILYACLSETFRKHFRTLLCGGRASRSARHDTDTSGYGLQEDSDRETSIV